jgi:hypothetical protein
MPGQRFVQRGAGLDVGLDGENEFLRGGLVVAAANDLQTLHQRNAGRQHGGELAHEDGDVLRLDLAAGLQGARLLADARGGDTLATQVRPQ